jgi:transposase
MAFINTVENQMCQPVIPARKNRQQPRDIDENLYKERHLIECFFGYLKQYRRVFSRFDKTALAFLQFVSTFIWLR